MVVYIEYAFAENFIMDLLLLYLSLKCARSRISWLRMIFAAAIGGVEAILFPVIAMPVWCAYFVKFLGGVLIGYGCRFRKETETVFENDRNFLFVYLRPRRTSDGCLLLFRH